MKRWLLRICVLLLLGAIVNVAVAWGCAITSEAANASFRMRGSGHGRIFRRTSTVPRETYRYVDETEENHLRHAQMIPPEVDERLAVDEYQSIGSLQSWYMPRYENVELLGPPWHFAVRIVCGWPLENLEGMTAPVPDGGSFVPKSDVSTETWAVRIDRSWKKWPDNVLPLRPIWPGFAINTVLYAVVVWLLIAGPFVVRRWRRIRRGLCPKCAYDLRGSDSPSCPECGAMR